MASGPPQSTARISPPASAKPLDQNDIDRGAMVLKEMSASGVLAVVAGKHYKNNVHPASFKKYRDQILAEADNPRDPVEIMLVEQLLWAHHRIGDLHAASAMADSAEVAEVYNSAATRLMSEFRRTSLALREYRAPNIPTQLTVVRQQNLAAGNQQVALIDGTGHSVASGKNTADSELVSKQEALTYEAPAILNAAADCRKAELVETAGPNGRRTPAPQGRRPDQPAVVALHRPALAGGQSEVSRQRQSAAAAIDLFAGAPAVGG